MRLKKTLLFILPLVVLVVLAEVGLRLSETEEILDPINTRVLIDPIHAVIPQLNATTNDYCEALRYLEMPCRRVTPDLPADTFRILCLGSSSTVGTGTMEESYPGVLETILNERDDGYRYEVIIFGVPGTNFYEQQMFFERFFSPIDLNMVIMMTGPNLRMDLQQYREQRFLRKTLRWLMHSVLFRRLYNWRKVDVSDRYQQSGHGNLPQDVYLEAYEDDLAQMLDRAKKDDFSLVFVQSFDPEYILSLQKLNLDADRPEDFERAMAMFLDQTMLKFTEKEGITFIPVFDIFLDFDQNMPDVWDWGPHPGKLSSRLIAQKVARVLDKNGLLPPLKK